MVLEVCDEDVVSGFRQSRFPHAADIPGVPPRARSVSRFRDSKRATRTSAEPVLVRAFAPMRATDGQAQVDLAELTRLTGAACVVIGDSCAWGFTARLAVVENLECFLHFEPLGVRADAALYAGGRLSERVLDWLASEPMCSCRYVHCGDYDPVGLSEFVRLRKRLGDRAQLHVPPNLRELLRAYGKRSLLASSAPIQRKLRQCGIGEVRGIVSLLDETGCGLEQEALLTSGAGLGGTA
jgi:hypothetical protein